jgi:cell division protein FtsQ
MKINKSLLFLVFVSLIFSFSFWFSNHKNKLRKEDEVQIVFTHSPFFLNSDLVNKLLTQNLKSKSIQEKDSLDLNMLETQLERTPEVENAEVFILPKGELSISITERTPLFQLATTPPLYVDENGVAFTYKTIDNKEYPSFLTDVGSETLKMTATLVKKLKVDPFLEYELKHVSFRDAEYSIQLKSYPFEVVFGNTLHFKKKINKLKIFCAFQNVQDSLSGYKKINLTYKNQVVASTP